MKSFYLFILLFILIGCKSSILERKNSKIIECPTILFSKENKVYIDSKYEDISLDNISYTAEINNAVFNKGCKIIDGSFSSKISILFVVNPLVQEQEGIKLPFYIAILDKQKNVENLEYFLINDNFKKNHETKNLIETEITISKQINFELNNNMETIIIGFMLDEEKIKLLN